MDKKRITWSPQGDLRTIGQWLEDREITVFGPRRPGAEDTPQTLWEATAKLMHVEPLDTRFIDFSDFEIHAHDPGERDGAEGQPTAARVLDNGRTLELAGNAWKAIEVNHRIQRDTVLSFEIDVPHEGEIHGVGVAQRLAGNSNTRLLQVHGTQDHHQVRRVGTYSGGTVHFEIPIGRHFPLGTWKYLLFVSDDDANGASLTRFSNARLYERTAMAEHGIRSLFLWDRHHPEDAREHFAGLLSARVSLSGVTVHLPGGSFSWTSADETFEGTLGFVQSRIPPREVDLVLAVDPSSWHRVDHGGHVHAHIHDATCVGGEIDLDLLKFETADGSGAAWSQALGGLGATLDEDDRPAGVRVSPSGVSLTGRPVFPWADSGTDVAAPLLISLPFYGSAPDADASLYVTLDHERLRAARFAGARAELVAAFNQLDRITRLPSLVPGQSDQGPRWVSLTLTRSEGLPEFHWELDAQEGVPRLPLHFEPGPWELGLSDDNRIERAARANLACFPQVTIDGQQDSLILTMRRTRPAAQREPDLSEFEINAEHADQDAPAEVDDESLLEFKVIAEHADKDAPTEVDDELLADTIELTESSIHIAHPERFAVADEAKIGAALASLEALAAADDLPSFRLAVARIAAALRRLTSRITYEFAAADNAPAESLVATRLPLGYAPVETAQFLREQEQLPAPRRGDDQVTAEDWVQPATLWGFVKMEDGWLELPFLNVTDQMYVDLLDPPGPAPMSVVSGAAVFSNQRAGSQPVSEQPWSMAITDVAEVSGRFFFAKSGDAYQLAKVEQLRFDRPSATCQGLAWLGTQARRPEDALPDLDNWLAGLRPLELRTMDAQTPAPSPFTFELNDHTMTPRADQQRSGSETGEALAGWSLTVRPNEDPSLLREPRVLEPPVTSGDPMPPQGVRPLGHAGILSWLLAAGPFSEKFLVGPDDAADLPAEPAFSRDDQPPLIWRRHPSLPVIQSLPLVQAAGSTDHPAASRELIPLQVRLVPSQLYRQTGKQQTLESRKLWFPAPFTIGVKSAESAPHSLGALKYPVIVSGSAQRASDAGLSEAIASLSHVCGAFLTLPGWSWYPHERGRPWQELWPVADRWLPAGLRVQCHAGLPVLDQTTALAGLNETRTSDAAQNAGSRAQAIPDEGQDAALTRDRYPAHWAQLNERARFAECAAQLMLVNQGNGNGLVFDAIVEPATWTAAGTADPVFPGKITLNDENTGTSIKFEGIDGLRGFHGFFHPLDDGRLTFDSAGGEWTVIAGSLESVFAPTDSGGESIRDQRGWRREFASTHPSNAMVVAKPLTSDRPGLGGDYILKTLLKSLRLQAGRQSHDQATIWHFGFTDLPFRADSNQFDSSRLRSDLAEDVNDPAMSAADRAPLTDYQWSLAGEDGASAETLRIAGVFPFFPLRLAAVLMEGGFVDQVSIVGRLQLPFQAEKVNGLVRHREATEVSNAVRLTFRRSGAGDLVLDDIAAEDGELLLAEPGQNEHVKTRRVSVPAELQWPLVSEDEPKSDPAEAASFPVLHLMPEGYRFTLPASHADALPARGAEEVAVPESLRGALAERGVEIAGNARIQHSDDYGWQVMPGDLRLAIDSLGLSVFVTNGPSSPPIDYAESDGTSQLILRNVVLTFSFQGVSWTSPLVVGETDQDKLVVPLNTASVPIQRTLPEPEDQPLFGYGRRVTLQLQPDAGGRYRHQVELRFVARWGKRDQPHVCFRVDCPIIPHEGATPDISARLVQFKTNQDASSNQWLLNCHDGTKSFVQRDISDSVLEFAWTGFVPAENDVAQPHRLQVLPGFHLRDPSGTEEDLEQPKGFAAMAFDVEPRAGQEPRFGVQTAFSEALIPCRWGSSLPFGDGATDGDGITEEQLYKSTSGHVYADVTWDYRPGPAEAPWAIDLLLNGFLELTNLVSWPQLEVGDDATSFSLPDVSSETARVRHVARVLFNQHRVPQRVLARGGGPVLFSLHDAPVWRPAAVVEHQFSRVTKDEGANTHTIVESRRFALAQEVRFATPRAFKRYLDKLDQTRSNDPHDHNEIHSIQQSMSGYAGGEMLDELRADPLLAELGQPPGPPVLLVEASVHACLGKEPRPTGDVAAASTVQVLPRAAQLSQLADPADFEVDFDGIDQPPHPTATVMGDGRILVDGEEVALDDLSARLEELVDSAGADFAWMQVEEPADQDLIAQVMNELQTAGFRNIGTSLMGRPWLRIPVPFLGRCQDRELDEKMDSASMLHVDPVRRLASADTDSADEIPHLLFHFTSRSAESPIEVTASVLERTWHGESCRLDPNSLLEGWSRFHTVADRLPSESQLGGVMASLAQNTQARVVREATLTAFLDPTRRAFPPVSASAPDPRNEPDSLSWHPRSLFMLQDVARFSPNPFGPSEGREQSLAFAITSLHISRAMRQLRFAARRSTGEGASGACTTHSAVTLLPMPHGEEVSFNLQPVDFAISPCLAIQQERLTPQEAELPAFVFAELLCLTESGNRLESVTTRSWEADELQEFLGDWDDLLVAWAEASHKRLAADSRVAVMRVRAVRPAAEEGNIVVDYQFRPLPEVHRSPRLALQGAARRGRPELLRFAESQLRTVQAVEFHPLEQVGPQPGAVQPLYERSRPPVKREGPPTSETEADDALSWPIGLSALHVDVRVTRRRENLVGRRVTGTAPPPRMWWNSEQIEIQFAINEDGASPRLPALFRSEVIGGFLQTGVGGMLPPVETHADPPPLESQSRFTPLHTYWQPWLIGGYRYLLVGARPGAPLLVHHRLLTHVATGESGGDLVSGSTAVMHRMPRPMHLPPNSPRRAERTFQTVGTSFELHHRPRRLFRVPDWPEVFRAAAQDPWPPQGVEIEHASDCDSDVPTVANPKQYIRLALPNPDQIENLTVEQVDSSHWNLRYDLQDAPTVWVVTLEDGTGLLKLVKDDGTTLTLDDWAERLAHLSSDANSVVEVLEKAADRSFLRLLKTGIDAVVEGLKSALPGSTDPELKQRVESLIQGLNEALSETSAAGVQGRLKALAAELRELAAELPDLNRASVADAIHALLASETCPPLRPWLDSWNPFVAHHSDVGEWLLQSEFANNYVVAFRCPHELAVVVARGPGLLKLTSAASDSTFLDADEPIGFEMELTEPVLRVSSDDADPPRINTDVIIHGDLTPETDLHATRPRLFATDDGVSFVMGKPRADDDSDNNAVSGDFEIVDSDLAAFNLWRNNASSGAPLELRMSLSLKEAAAQKYGVFVRGLVQEISLPMRLHKSDSLTLPHLPRYAQFEDPEYNRFLASAPARKGRPTVFQQGNKKPLFDLVLAADRTEFAPTDRITFLFYVDSFLFSLLMLPDDFRSMVVQPSTIPMILNKYPDLKEGLPDSPPIAAVLGLLLKIAGYEIEGDIQDIEPLTADTRFWRFSEVAGTVTRHFVIRIHQDELRVYGHFPGPIKGSLTVTVIKPSGNRLAAFREFKKATEDTQPRERWEADMIRELDIAEGTVFENGSNIADSETVSQNVKIEPGDAIELKVELPENDDVAPEGGFAALRVNVVDSTNAAPPAAAYALLRRTLPAGGMGDTDDGVAAPRFAWSPKPLRIELTNPDDLKGPIVRRRALFRWQDTVRTGSAPQYAIQKTTTAGETHIPAIGESVSCLDG